jgi:hypothetical protein
MAKFAWALLPLMMAPNSTLRAVPLITPEKAYVVLMTVSVAVTNMCDGYDVDDASVLKFTEARGVDIHKLGPAILNAIEAIADTDADYDRLAPGSHAHRPICFGGDEARCIEIGKSGRLPPVRQDADACRLFEKAIQIDEQGWNRPFGRARLGGAAN